MDFISKGNAVQSQKPIAILGAGSWGTALALYLGRRGQTVHIWSIEASEIAAMNADRENKRYLPGHPLPNTIHPMTDLAQSLDGVQDALLVVPSVGFRSTLEAAKKIIHPGMRFICASKGLEAETGHLLSEVAADVLGQDYPFAVLSGPSFAREVAAGLPTAVVIASQSSSFLSELIELFDSDIFHVVPSDDITGVEVGGVVKNVIAIVTGISDGLQFGTNARSALITRGLAEITALGIALGGKAQTFVGLSGLGDLILTCSDDQSRNRRLGLAIGKGKNIEAAEQEIGQVVEGKRNAEIVVRLADKLGVDMPICQMVWQILQGKGDPKRITQIM